MTRPATFWHKHFRRLRYRLWYGTRWHALLGYPLYRLNYRFAERRTSFEGMGIVDVSIRGTQHERFIEDTLAALALIRSVDSRRFVRLQREVKFIVNVETLFGTALYRRVGRICEVDYNALRFGDDGEWNAWIYACILVHEATHGVIHSRLVVPTTKTRVRVERLCHTEEQRFAKRADAPDRLWSDSLVGPFDETQWHTMWKSTRLQSWRRGYHVIRDAIREPKK